jgi:hypothetical protein
VAYRFLPNLEKAGTGYRGLCRGQTIMVAIQTLPIESVRFLKQMLGRQERSPEGVSTVIPATDTAIAQLKVIPKTSEWTLRISLTELPHAKSRDILEGETPDPEFLHADQSHSFFSLGRQNGQDQPWPTRHGCQLLMISRTVPPEGIIGSTCS